MGVSGSGGLQLGSQAVVPASTAAANILSALVTVAAAGTTQIVSVPAGRTWQGSIGCAASAQNPAVTATGLVIAAISVSGAGVTPAAGQYVRVPVELAATLATAVVGEEGANASDLQPFVVVAPAGNAVAINLVVAVTGVITSFEADGWATGALL